MTYKENTTHSVAKSVNQIDINTGDILNTYKSIKDAVNALGIQTRSDGGISSCCRGRRFTAYGYKWLYKI